MPATANGLIVRDAVPGDVDALVRFNVALASEADDVQLDPATARVGVESALKRSDLCRYFVAELGGEPIGQLMITYEWSDWRAGVFWWLSSVYVREDCRRRGVFRALHEHVVALARQGSEVCGLRLYVHHTNDRAMKTYARMGMRPSGHVVYEIDWS